MLRKIALYYLIFLFSWGVGFLMSYKHVWPYSLLMDLKYLIKESRIGFWETVQNDLFGYPSKVLSKYQVPNDTKFAKVEIPKKDRRAEPILFMDPNIEGYRFLMGAFDFKDSLYGAILIDKSGKVIHRWKITQENLPWSKKPDIQVFPHGVSVFPDGSLIVSFDHGDTLMRLDSCSNVKWSKQGDYHHLISQEGDTFFWTWKGDSMVKLDIEKGQEVKELKLQDIIGKHLDTDIFAIRQNDQMHKSTYYYDPWHANDVEPLSANMASAFPKFMAGDLLVSLRSLNLIFVLDPETLDIKWWKIGYTRRQHDPDWLPSGEIMAFDNNMHRGDSRIKIFTPGKDDLRTFVDGKKYNFRTHIMGQQQLVPNGSIVVTSATEGRVLEINSNGEVVFDFINKFKDDYVMWISKGEFLSENFFAPGALKSCQGI